MASRLATYNSENVIVKVANILVTDGRAEEFLTVEYDNDHFTSEPGADGLISRYGTNDFRATATLTLKSASLQNSLFAALANLDLSTFNGQGVVPFTATDLNGNTIIRTPDAWIKKIPAWGAGVSAPDVAWPFELVLRPGGFNLGSF